MEHWSGGECGRSEEWWEVEPDVGRLVDGLPNRVPQLRALGNSIVPQIAQSIPRAKGEALVIDLRAGQIDNPVSQNVAPVILSTIQPTPIGHRLGNSPNRIHGQFESPGNLTRRLAHPESAEVFDNRQGAVGAPMGSTVTAWIAAFRFCLPHTPKPGVS